MVSYSARSVRALAFLKSNYNDVEIFVEDCGNHNMWLTLIRKMLPSNTRLTSVNALGGRGAVLEACRLDQQADGRRKLYIIDGDFDYLNGIKKERLRYLYRVRAYCIENILISEPAVINIGMGLKPTLGAADCALKFGFDSWFLQVTTTLLPLFIVYAIVMKRAPKFQTIKYNVSNLYIQGSKGVDICPIKTRHRILSLSRQLRGEIGLSDFRNERKEIAERLKKLAIDEVISGKDYLLPVLHRRLSAVFGYRGDVEQLKVRLSEGWIPNERAFARRVGRL